MRSGHTDVVPIDGQPWDTDPLIVEKDGRLFGRGTCDMKGFLAIGLGMIPDMLKSGMKRPIHFALSYDEEVGCLGAPDMIVEMARELPPHAVIVGEPSSMRVINAHKGMTGMETIVTGHEAHSSQTHRGVSAVMTAARLITFLDDMAKEKAAGPHSTDGFEPPYTSIHVGVVRGGTATNIISRECRFNWDVRNARRQLPRHLDRFYDYCDSLLPEMKAIAPEANIETIVHCRSATVRAHDGRAERLKQLSGRNWPR